MQTIIRLALALILLVPAVYSQFVYVVNNSSETISGYRIDTNSGVLTRVGTFQAGRAPAWVAVDPTNRFVYAPDINDNGNVWGFEINQATGALTRFGVFPSGGTNVFPYAITVDSSGKFLFATNIFPSTISVYRIDPNSGALTLVVTQPTGLQPKSVAVDPRTQFVYTANLNSSNVSAFRINPSTGDLTSIGTFTVGAYPEAVAIEPTGRFAYVVNQGVGGVSGFRIDPFSGVLTSLGSPFPSFPNGGPSDLAIHPNGKFAYIVNRSTNNISAFSIDENGLLAPMGTAVPAGSEPRSMAIDPHGKFAYVANVLSGNVSMYSITSVGLLEPIGSPIPAGLGAFTVAIGACSIAPAISNLTANPAVLWPPDHKMVNITVAYSVVTPCDNPVCSLSVASNQTPQGSDDWAVLGPHLVALRAERAGTGTDRIYSIDVSCQDGRGNSASKSLAVVVPHDNRNNRN